MSIIVLNASNLRSRSIYRNPVYLECSYQRMRFFNATHDGAFAHLLMIITLS